MRITTPMISLKRYLRVETGMAAIEFAFILPFMLVLYFGLLDLTGLITANRKMTSTAGVVADLVGQNPNSVTAAKISDYMLVSDMINNPGPDSGVTVRVLNYRKVGSNAVLQWSRTKPGGPGCSSVSTAGLTSLMDAGNDIIIAQACMTYEPYIATFLGDAIIGATSFNVQQMVMVRPRSTNQLACSGC